MNKYKVVITISHRSISLEYHLQGAGERLEPFGKGKWPAPLAFYYSGDGFVIGEEAVTAAQMGNSNAYTDYFDIIRTDRRFTFGGHSFPVNQLLLRGVEDYFQYFFREVWCGNLGELEANRSEMPLILAFDSDIENNEKVVLAQAFRDWGYGRLKTVSYSDIIGDYLNRISHLPHTLVAWSDGRDMHFSLYKKGEKRPVAYRRLPGKLGKDPRVDLICERIWNKDLVYQIFGLSYEQELPRLRKEAVAFLKSNEAETDGEVTLSDGYSYNYYLNRYSINSLSLEYEESEALQRQLRHFLEENGITDRSQVKLLLRGDASGNDYFRGQLAPGFGNVEDVDKEMQQDAKKILIDISFDKDESPEPSRNPRPADSIGAKPKTPPVDFGIFTGIEPEPAPEPREVPVTPPSLPDTPTIDKRALRELKRELREKLAIAKGKRNVDKFEEAIALFEECVSIAGDNFPELKADAEAELQETVKKQRASSKPVGRKPEVAPRKPEAAPASQRPSRAEAPHRRPEPKSPERAAVPEEGEVLIAKGKLKEARDWYRAQGRNAKASLISDVIRAQRGIRQRSESLETYKRDKDPVKTQRVVDELQDYVDCCAKAGVPCANEQKLLSEYKKILR